MTQRIGFVPGDGIGQEVLAAARKLLGILLPGAEIVERALGFERWQRDGVAYDEQDIEALAACDAILLGAVGSPSTPAPGYSSPVVALRRGLELFATVRPARSLADGVDMLIFRETSEGLYSGLELTNGDRAECRRVVTRQASERFLRYARAQVEREGRRRVTIVHKANVLRQTCGLFREVALEVFRGADLVVDEMLVDSAAYRMARSPQSFDVIVTTNLFGDILSDLAAAFAGGLGLASSSSIGHRHALFEPVHGSAPDIAGQGIANPIATFRALESLLDHIELPQLAERLRCAVDRTLESGPRTPDMGGQARTADILRSVVEGIVQASALEASNRYSNQNLGD